MNTEFESRPYGTYIENATIFYVTNNGGTIVKDAQDVYMGQNKENRFKEKDVEDAEIIDEDRTTTCDGPTSAHHRPSRNDCIKMAIISLMNLRENGEYLFSKHNDWWIIYRRLVDKEGFSRQYATFYEQMKQMGMDDFRVSCTYEQIADINGIYQRPVEEWKVENYRGERPGTLRRKKKLAACFEEILEKTFKENGF